MPNMDIACDQLQMFLTYHELYLIIPNVDC